MSDLTKKRVHWTEYNGDELLHNEDVDILTSADSVTFSDGEDLQYKYTQGQFVNPSTTGILSNLSTTNKSSLVDAVNEVNTVTTNNTTSIIDLTARVTPINKGGTGATTASEAIANLGAATTETYTATLSTTWTGTSAPYTQTVAIADILATDTPIADIVLSSDNATALAELEAYACVSKIETGDGNITVTCIEDKPETALTLQLKVIR